MPHPRRTHWRPLTLLLLLVAALASGGALPSGPGVAAAAGPLLPHPLLFVTHVPTTFDVLTTVTIFGNQLGDLHAAGRGGDLWLRMPDGTLRNLTAAAGLGVAGGLQGAGSIAVRDPAVSWDGTRALFSMVKDAPAGPTATPPRYLWQIYEVTNLGQVVGSGVTPVIQKVAHQPDYNNITPIYGTNGRIIFTSDAPRFGQAHLYPLLDEYNMRPTNSGLWSLDPASGDLFQIDDSPSGDMTPIIDSFGRVVFVRWDHLERDQQFDLDAQRSLSSQPCVFCTFNYADESAQALTTTTTIANNPEVFPEPRPRTFWLSGTNLNGHHMNEFMPWAINQDGTAAETIDHIGRHELLDHIPAVFNDDPNLIDMNGPQPGSASQNRVKVFLQVKEDPANPGNYYGVNAQESTHASGQIVRLTGAGPSYNADQIALDYITHHDTYSTTTSLGDPSPPPHSDGHYRDPLPLSDGTLVASYTTIRTREGPIPGQPVPPSVFDFRLYTMGPDASNPGYMAHSQLLTGGLPTKTLSYYDKTTLVQFSGQLWELQPVEVYARAVPAGPGAAPLALPEQNAFADPGVHISEAQLRTFLAQQNLALIVSRNVTRRDDADVQQPLRLRVGAAGASSVPPGSSGKLYQIDFLQIMQADQLRGLSGSGQQPGFPGRRVLAQPLHDPAAQRYNPANPTGPAGSVVLGQDGSMAAFVPARRAVSWQLTDAGGAPVVRERIWVTMQPGEIRVCAACHGINDKDQTGAAGVPANTPQALIALLKSAQALIAATPSLSVLGPSAASAGGASFTLTVDGAQFANDAQLRWNNSPRPTTFVNSTRLTAQISAADIAAQGSASVTVTNPSAGTSSNALTFTVGVPAALNNKLYLPLLAR